MAAHSLDHQVIFDNLWEGTLNVDQAYALFREELEAARYFLCDRLPKIFPVLDKAAKGQAPGNPFGDPAKLERILISLEKLQGNSQAARLRELDSPGGRILEVCWRIFGPCDCINLFLSYPDEPLVACFLEEKLQNALDQFSDEDLVRLSDGYRNKPMMHRVIVNARGRRLIPIANQLLRNPPEINEDLANVKKRVSECRFPPELNAVIDKVEDGLANGGDPFDQAALLKHLRTFFEKLHEQVGQKLRTEKSEAVDATDLGKCGQALEYLNRKGVLTEKMRDLGKALYGVLSEEGVHALKSKREYVRLCRNLVAEYAVVLFFELERRLEA